MRQYFYILYNVLLTRRSQSNIDWRGFDDGARGDCIFRSGILAIALSIKDPWTSAQVLIKCWNLLRQGYRWPDELNHDPIPGKPKQRSQKSMTRDPWIMILCATYIITGGINEALKIPVWLRRSYLSAWVKYLKTGDNRFSARFERRVARLLWFGKSTEGVQKYVTGRKGLDWIKPVFGLYTYSIHLYAWMAYVARNKKVQDMLLPHIESWNLELRLLCGDFVSESEVESYVSVEGYMWTSETWLERPAIPETDQYHLDKDIIEYLLDNKKNY